MSDQKKNMDYDGMGDFSRFPDKPKKNRKLRTRIFNRCMEFIDKLRNGGS